jgi:transposase
VEFNPSQRLDSRENRTADSQDNGVADVCQVEFYPSSSAPGASETGKCGRTNRVQKKLVEQVEQIKRENPAATVQLWSEDEARFGLQPIMRRRWAKVGKRPLAETNPCYEWTWSYGAVEMATGESFFLILPNLQAGSVEIFLSEFAKAQGVSKQKIAILLWDGAPAHRAALKVPAGIELVRLPAYTPELNPSERLWSPLRETVANRWFEQIEEMEDVLINGIRDLSGQKEYLSSLTNYHWLPSP